MSRSSSREDWVCSDSKCKNINFAKRDKCHRCGKPRKYGYGSDSRPEIGKHASEKSKGLFSPDDWICKSCGNINWARRSTCNVCNTPKVDIQGERTGYGGGFMERDEVVEYNRYGDSDDDEFDEFGRKKKRFRKGVDEPAPEEDRTESSPQNTGNGSGKTASAATAVAERKSAERDAEDDDEDEEESGDEADLAKYDVWGADDDGDDNDGQKLNNETKSNATKGQKRTRSQSSSSSGSDDSDDSSSSSSSSGSSSSGKSSRVSRSGSSSSSRSRSSNNHPDRKSRDPPPTSKSPETTNQQHNNGRRDRSRFGCAKGKSIHMGRPLVV